MAHRDGQTQVGLTVLTVLLRSGERDSGSTPPDDSRNLRRQRKGAMVSRTQGAVSSAVASWAAVAAARMIFALLRLRA